MFLKLKNIFFAFFMIIATFIGWNTYLYFFDSTLPELKLNGLEHDNYYCGDVQCLVASNKSGSITIWLDGQTLIMGYKMGGGEQEQPFVIPTKTLTNGKHNFKAEFVDRSYKKNKINFERTFNVDNLPLQAAFVKADTDNKVFQGRTFHVQFQTNKEVRNATIKTLSSAYNCYPESKDSLIYDSFIPIS